MTYFVCGVSGEGEKPEAFYPTVDSFIGEGGSYTNPRAIKEDARGMESGICEEGKEAFGGIRFQDVFLKSGESVTYTILLGATENEQEISEIIKNSIQQKK